MASIVENILGDKALQLANCEFVRKLSFGNQWTFMRIGMRVRIFGSASTATPAMFHVGLNNGDVNTYNSPICDGYIGIVPGTNSGGSNFYYTYDSLNKRYGSNTTYWYMNVTKTGGSTAFAHYGGTGQSFYAGAAAKPRLFMVGFLRTASTSVTPYFYPVTSAQYYYGEPDLYTLLRIMQIDTLDAFATNYISNPPSSAAVTSPANLDTLSLYWNRNIPALEIHDLCVVRYY